MDDKELDAILERLAECDTIESDEDGHRSKTELNFEAIDAIYQLRARLKAGDK